VANPTGSNTDLPAANYKGSDQGNTGGSYQTSTKRYYIPTSGVANSTGSKPDLHGADYKGSDQGSTGGSYQTSTSRYIPTSSGFIFSPDVFTSSPSGLTSSTSEFNPSPSGFTNYSTGTSGGFKPQPTLIEFGTFSNNDPLTASFDGLTLSPPTATQAVQPGGVAAAKVIKSAPNSGAFEKLDPSE
jgi:hypothetical protein